MSYRKYVVRILDKKIAMLLAVPLLVLGAADGEARTVLMISVDGMNPEYVTEAASRGLKMPNLSRFMVEGSYASGVIPTCAEADSRGIPKAVKI